MVNAKNFINRVSKKFFIFDDCGEYITSALYLRFEINEEDNEIIVEGNYNDRYEGYVDIYETFNNNDDALKYIKKYVK